MHGEPKVIEIDLGNNKNLQTYEERKRTNRFRQSTLSQRHVVNSHPFADSPTIKHSIIDWITTFKNLPRYPATISEFVSSGALYFIMEEIDAEYFRELPYSTLSKKDTKMEQDPKVLKKVYKHMLQQMELWFNAHSDASNEMRPFKPDRIDLIKLIQYQDINEVLVVIEFILCIVLKCANSENLL